MRIFLIILALLLPFPATAKTVQDKPGLWKVSDADTTIWLFGTIHMLRPGHDWLRGPVRTAFDSADTLAIETRIPDPQTAQAAILKIAVDPNGRTLAKVLPAKLHDKLLAQIKAYGMPPEAMEPVEPWYAALTLEILAYQRLGFAAGAGVEQALVAGAEQDRKTVIGLEKFEEQISYFDRLTEQQQIELLSSTLRELPDSDRQIGHLVSAWSKGDIAKLAKLLNSSMDQMPEIADLLLTQRNRRWAEWIAKRMDKPGVVFMAVGAGHLGGSNNVRDLLALKGFSVERVQ